jgi:metal-responsive CopG/Arc/MetJ family transcriptional regulator
LNLVIPGGTYLEVPRKPLIGLRLDPDELELLDALAEKEERNRSDVIRRAIRAYAEALGVTVKSKKRPAKR